MKKVVKIMWLERTELLLGSEKCDILREANVLVVGLGGVGAYAAEMIARAGVGTMTIADADVVGESRSCSRATARHQPRVKAHGSKSLHQG